jgi:hypothetical protein
MGKPYGAIGSILGNKQKIHFPPPPHCHKEKIGQLMNAC